MIDADNVPMQGMSVDEELNQQEYWRGYEEALINAVDAVKALPDWKFCDAVCGTERSAIAAIESLGEEKP